MSNLNSPQTTRRLHERGVQTRTKIIEVAFQEFSLRGYDAITVRDIEASAGVKRNLVQHHFTNKENLWKATADYAFTIWRDYHGARREFMTDLAPKERLAYTVRSFVRYNALHPELHRLITREMMQDSWRLHYLVDMHIGKLVGELKNLFEIELDLEPKDFFHVYYVLSGGGATPFAMGPEASMLFGVDVEDEKVIERHADFMVELLVKIQSGKAFG